VMGGTPLRWYSLRSHIVRYTTKCVALIAVGRFFHRLREHHCEGVCLAGVIKNQYGGTTGSSAVRRAPSTD